MLKSGIPDRMAHSNAKSQLDKGDIRHLVAPVWSIAPAALTFPIKRIAVWKVSLDDREIASDVLAAGNSLLSADEIERAKRFHFERDQTYYTHCRLVLRHLLGNYLGIPSEEVRFEYRAQGKPQLAADQNPRALHFNVSHSAGLALIAVGSEHQLGVDLERRKDGVDTAALAERFFSPNECAGLKALTPSLQVAAFYACWTRKEAFLKATGDGLSFPLAGFSVTTHPEHTPVVEEIRGDFEAARRWNLIDLNVAQGYRAALACDRSVASVETYTWN